LFWFGSVLGSVSRCVADAFLSLEKRNHSSEIPSARTIFLQVPSDDCEPISSLITQWQSLLFLRFLKWRHTLRVHGAWTRSFHGPHRMAAVRLLLPMKHNCLVPSGPGRRTGVLIRSRDAQMLMAGNTRTFNYNTVLD
jgi:hypothetical protein